MQQQCPVDKDVSVAIALFGSIRMKLRTVSSIHALPEKRGIALLSFGLLGLLALHTLCTGVQYSVLPIRLWNLKLGNIILNCLFNCYCYFVLHFKQGIKSCQEKCK